MKIFTNIFKIAIYILLMPLLFCICVFFTFLDIILNSENKFETFEIFFIQVPREMIKFIKN